MFYSYLISTYRLLIRRKMTSLIMIGGLAVAMTVSFIILEYVRFESTFDHHNEKADRIFRVTHSLYENNKLQYQRAQSFIPTGETLKNEFESVEDFTTLFKISDQTDVIISTPSEATTTQSYNEKSVYHVKGNFFRIFSVRMLEGEQTPTSIERTKVFISSSTARKYFGDESPINRTLEHQYSGEFTVEGVFEDFPPNSHFHPDFLFGWTPLSNEASGGDDNNWRWDGFFTYILLKTETDKSVVENNFSAVFNKHLSTHEGRQSRFMLQPLTDIHLHSHLLGEAESNGNFTAINLMKALVVFVLIMAYVNFINLASAYSVERLKQIAIRKIVGSGLLQLRFQFLIEGFIINLIAGILAACFVYMSSMILMTLGILPHEISNLQLSWFLFLSLMLICSALGCIFYTASITNIEKATLNRLNNQPSWRASFSAKRIMLTGQFTISIIVATLAIVAFKQVRFMQEQGLGIDLSRTLVIQTLAKFGPPDEDSIFRSKLNLFKYQISALSTVKGSTASYDIPGKEHLSLFSNFKSIDGEKNVALYYSRIDADFFPLFNIPIVAGRNFFQDESSDPTSVIINKEALKELGFDNTHEAVGSEIALGNGTNERKLKIVGIVDFRSTSFKNKNFPTVYQNQWAPMKYLSLKITSENSEEIGTTLRFLKQQWMTIFADVPMDYFFLDDFFNAQYKADKNLISALTLIAGVTVFIAIIGLYGLASIVTLQRTREVGIRKILGATIKNIISLLIKDFAIVVVIAGVISAPITSLISNNWLAYYSIQTNMPVWIFVVPTLVMLAMVSAAITHKVLGVANSNPASVLKEN